MRPQTKWQILALVLMTTLPLTTSAADKDVRAKELDAIPSKAVAPGTPVSYGFGWFLDSYLGHPRIWHNGTTIGFRNVIERFTMDRDRLTIVILCNRADFDPIVLAFKIFDLYREAAK